MNIHERSQAFTSVHKRPRASLNVLKHIPQLWQEPVKSAKCQTEAATRTYQPQVQIDQILNIFANRDHYVSLPPRRVVPRHVPWAI